MIITIIISILFTLPYITFLKKRYDEANDKQLFIKTNFYQSNLWILLLIILCLSVVNFFFSDNTDGVNTKEPVNQTDIQLFDSLSELKYSERHNIDFHYQYLNAYSNKKYLDSRTDAIIDAELLDYYDSISNEGFGDLSNWGKGLYFLKVKRVDSASFYLNSVNSKELKYWNHTIGLLNAFQKKDSIAFEFFKREVLLENGAKQISIEYLLSFYLPLGDLNVLGEIYHLPEANRFFSFDISRKILFYEANLVSYYSLVLEWFIKLVDPIDVIAAFLILLIWISFMVRLSFFQKVRIAEIVTCLLLGMLFTFLTFLISDALEFSTEGSAFWNTFTWSVIGIGAVEELVKVIPLLIMILVIKRKLQAYEYIMFASISALGFAFAENQLYFDNNYGMIISGRALTAAVGHMVFSSVFAYGLVLSRIKHKKNTVGFFFLFWLNAAILHGLYDFWIFINTWFFFILFFLLCSRIWNTVINNSINQSAGFSYKTNVNTGKLQFFLAFSLTALMLFEYILVAWNYGKETANSNLLVAFLSGGFLIAFLGSKLSSLNLIKNYWGKINYSINPFSDDVVSQNFVGEKVFLSHYYIDSGLVEYFPEGVIGLISSRAILQNKVPKFFSNNDDPDWFLIKLKKPLNENGFRNDRVLIKFKDGYSSLNDQKRFMVKLLLIPDRLKVKSKYPMRNEFTSLGWCYLSEYRPNMFD